MATYSRPQVELFEVIELVPQEILNPLRALIVGPNGLPHRYSAASEKVNISLGAYNPNASTCYNYPGQTPGSVIDLSNTGALPYPALFIDNALLQYYQHLVGSSSTLLTAVNGLTNTVKANNVSFKANGTSYPRSPQFLDRDVQPGDTAHLRGFDVHGQDWELWTTVSGFGYQQLPASVGPASEDVNNPGTQSLAVSIAQIAGPINGIVAEVNALGYIGLASGNINEVYTVTVTRPSVQGNFTQALLRVTSASGNDNVASVIPAANGNPTAIGTRGLIVVFGTSNTAQATSEALHEGVSLDDLLLGQTWQIAVSQKFVAREADSGGTYAGAQNDTYVITVTKGGTWAQQPQITVTTAKGLDYSGPTTITGYDTQVPIGTQGVTITFFGSGSHSSTDMSGHRWNAPIAGLRLGDKFYVPVTAAANGAANELALANNIPVALYGVTDLELELYINTNIQVPQNRVGFAPVTNWQASSGQFCVQNGILAYNPTWTSGGVQQPLPVTGGNMYLQYREWLPALVGTISAIQEIADLSALIPGPLDVDNPLSMAVSKALANANGTIVRYLAVSDPTQLAAWQLTLAAAKGRHDLYNYVPLTTDPTTLQLFQSQAASESGPNQSNPKAMFLQLTAPASTARVNSARSTDGNTVLATITANPNIVSTQYTLVTVPPQGTNPTGNAHFITNGVQPGDVLFYNFTTDGFGNTTYSQATVATVLSEESLLLAAGILAPIAVAQKIEVWHNYNKNELAANLAVAAGTYGDNRVVAVWPDTVSEGGVSMPGYMLCAALAGYVSGIAPHQSLTNATISGFDNVSRASTFFNSDQLDTIAGGGVWIVTQDPSGNIITRDALTTNMIDIKHRLEDFRRNLDSQAILYVSNVQIYLGRMNVVPSALDILRAVINQTTNFLKSNGYTPELGSQLVDGKIAQLSQHPLLADTVIIVLDLTLPVTLDTIMLTLVA